MAASFPCAAMFWLAYELSKYFIHTNMYTNAWLNVGFKNILASAIAETCQAVVRCPFEVVKQNMQIGKYKTTMDAVNGIRETKGLAGFYAGFGAFVARDIPFAIIQFPLYEFLKMTSISILASNAKVPIADY